MKIYKFPVPLENDFVIEMPIGSKVLSFQEQHGNLCIWAAVWPNSSLEERKFSIIGTGHDVDMDSVVQFIGTVQQLKGTLVWHLFEMKK